MPIEKVIVVGGDDNGGGGCLQNLAGAAIIILIIGFIIDGFSRKPPVNNNPLMHVNPPINDNSQRGSVPIHRQINFASLVPNQYPSPRPRPIFIGKDPINGMENYEWAGRRWLIPCLSA